MGQALYMVGIWATLKFAPARPVNCKATANRTHSTCMLKDGQQGTSQRTPKPKPQARQKITKERSQRQ
jgi:hypothetical protein